MLNTKDAMLAHLADARASSSARSSHPPVFTVEEAQAHTHHLPGGHCKNLFLKDKKDRLWLVTCLDDQRVDLNRLSRLLGAARFSFGKAELLQEVLGVTPGQRDAFGDRQRCRRPGHARCSTPSCWRTSWSTATRSRTTPPPRLRSADLLRFVRATGHEPVLIDLDLSAGGVADLLPLAALLLPTGAMTVDRRGLELARPVSRSTTC